MRVNLIKYANLNTEQILSKFKVEETLKKNVYDNNKKSNMIEIDENSKIINGSNCAKSDNNSYVSLVEKTNNLVEENVSDKNNNNVVFLQNVATKRNFKSSKSLKLP